MALSADLRPTGRNRVIDLVRAAGVDVTNWGEYSRGVKYAAVNPRYCYEWSFVDPRGIVVLNLWFRNIDEQGGSVVSVINMRELSKDLSRRGSKAVWVKRASRMDDAIRHAVATKSRIRVIVNEGDMRVANDPEEKAAVVRSRLLDPMPWSVRRYDVETGMCELVRGAADIRSIDQFDIDEEVNESATRTDRHRMEFLRNPQVRASVLARAAGRCEFCGSPGFITVSGNVFLETHHIVPLADGGADTVENAAALCANHHREAHYGASSAVIREFLLDRSVKSSRRRAVS